MTDQASGPDAATGVPDNEVLRALSAAIASLFGDAPDSWLLDAEDVFEHLQGDGYRIVKADRLERIQKLAHGAELFRQGETNEDRMAGLLLMDMTLPKMRPGDLDPGESEAGR